MLATDQLNGSTPSITAMVARDTVKVFDPTRGSYVDKPANNPAWACYDLIHRCKFQPDPRLGGQWVISVGGAAAKDIRYSEFLDWAEYCEERNLRVNLLLTEQMTLQSALREIGQIGRGNVVLRGLTYGCICDRPMSPQFTFSMGNLIPGTFHRHIIGKTDLANAVEIRFSNQEKYYQADTLMVYGPTYDTDEHKNPTQVTLNGCVSWEQAYRAGLYMLRCNAYLRSIVSFSAPIDAIAVQEGDVVFVQHDLTMGAKGGRVVEVSGSGLRLDQLISLEAGKTYRISVKNQRTDALEEQQWIPEETRETDWLPFAGAEEASHQDAVYILSQVGGIPRKYRVTRISSEGEYEKELEMLEYRDEVYAGDDEPVPEREYSPPLSRKPATPILSVYPNLYLNQDQIVQSQLNLTWEMPEGTTAEKFAVFYSDDNRTWNSLGVMESRSYVIPAILGSEYWVKVIALNGFFSSDLAIAGPIDAGTDEAPPLPFGFLVERLPDGTRRFRWSYEYPELNDVAGFILRYNVGSDSSWLTSKPLSDGIVKEQLYEIQAIRGGPHTILLKAADNAGNLSLGTAVIFVNMGEIPAENILWQHSSYEGGFKGIIIGAQLHEQTGYLDGIDTDAFWNAGGEPAWFEDTEPIWTTNFTSIEYLEGIHVPVLGQLLLEADTYPLSYWFYRYAGQSPYWKPEVEPVWAEDPEPAWEEAAEWVPWTGKMDLEHHDLEFRIEVPGGIEKGQIREVRVIVDVPDIEEVVEDLEFNPMDVGGTVIPIQKQYYAIKTLTATIQDRSGDEIVYPQITSKHPEYPRMRLVNEKGNPVSGIADITIKGY